MKFSRQVLAATLLLPLLATAAHGQDETVKELEQTGRSLIENPRFQGLFRSVKEDPEEAAAQMKQDPDEAVREATRIFTEKKEEIDLEKLDTPENRAKAESVAEQARETLSKMLPEEEKPAAEVPATRPAVGGSIKATPVAVPLSPVEDPPALPDPDREMVVQEATVEPLATAPPTEAQLPTSPELSQAEVPDPEPLQPRYNTEARPTEKTGGKQSMEITSAESIFDQKGGALTFKGNVFLQHPEFELKCDTLLIEMGGGGTAMPGAGGMSNFSRAIASGGMVEMKTIAPDGKTQVAMARRADYNKAEGLVTLSGGPPYIQDGDKFVQTTAEDARIIMYLEDKRYEIIGDRSRIVIPMDQNDKSEGIFPGAGLGFDQ